MHRLSWSSLWGHFCRHYDLSWMCAHVYSVFHHLSSLQCPRPLSSPSCCSQRAAEARSEQPLPGAHYIGAAPETSSYHAGKIGSSLPWISCTVVSRKNAHGRSTLQVCQRGGWVLFRVVPHLTMKEHPCHACSDSMPLKQIIGHATASGFEVESWRHTTLWMVPHHQEHGVALAVHTALAKSVYAQLPLVKYYTKFLTSDMHKCSTWGCASQTLCEARSRVDTHLSKLWSLQPLSWDYCIPPSSFPQDTCEQVRDRFVHKLNKGLKSLRLPLGYLSIFALAGIEPRKEIRLQVFEQNDLADFNIKFLLLQLLLGCSILNYYEHTYRCTHICTYRIIGWCWGMWRRGGSA